MNSEHWQPIETAPKDGTDILLFHSRSTIGIGNWGICRPQTFNDYYVAGMGRPVWRTRDRIHLFPKPSHWMPLPGPPKP